MAQSPLIHQIHLSAGPYLRYEKVEFTIDLSAQYSNPYDYNQVRLWATFVSPAGDSLSVDGFYLEPFQGPDASGTLTPAGPGGFRLRFTPDQAGLWTYTFSLSDAHGSTQAPPGSFSCQAGPPSPGFVRQVAGRYLQRDDGSPFVPLGLNLAWPASNPALDYRRWLDSLQARDANAFRVWNCDWGLSLEWLGGGYAGLGQYRQDKAAYLDWLFEQAASQDMAFLLCLHHHGQLSTQVNPQWHQNPYNAANGGMCAQPSDFFTHPQARAWTRNRLRYLLARYGYARSLLAWELGNELDFVDGYDIHQPAIVAWHDEMGRFLKEHDPYGHLVTTSFAHSSYDPDVWSLPVIDFTQSHHYAPQPNLERRLAQSVRTYRDDYPKPTLVGEFGLETGGATLASVDPDGIHLHNSLWASVYAGGMGAAFSWWWDTYVEPQGLFRHLGPLAARVGSLPLLAAGMQPAPARVQGAPGETLLVPSLGWGELADTVFLLDAEGTLSPPDAALSTYLYGAVWNTQYRRPPVFQLDYPAAGTFSLQTGATQGQDPEITIFLDGLPVLQQPGQVHQTYTLPIPAGGHSLRVENTGTDWITVASYTFAGLGSAIDPYVLRSAGGRWVGAWLFHHRYTHAQLQSQGSPPAQVGAVLELPGSPAGAYEVRWYDCLSGAEQQRDTLVSPADTLRLPIPALVWDLALEVTPLYPTDLAATEQG
ncbi:MAG: DUF5060 domain-containing protein, partial [Bacteroidetes bacterium]